MRRDTAGVSAIELVVVVFVIALLATIAIPRMNAARERAYLATARSDLRNLASVQAVYHSSNQSFANDVALVGFVASEYVTVTIADADASSWSATAVHARLASTTCSITVNSIDEATDGDNVVTCAEVAPAQGGRGNAGRGGGSGRGADPGGSGRGGS